MIISSDSDQAWKLLQFNETFILNRMSTRENIWKRMDGDFSSPFFLELFFCLQV